MLDDQLDRSILLARQAVALDDTVRTRGNLLSALLRSPAAIGVIRADHATVLSAAVNPYASTLAVGNIAGEVLLFDTDPAARRHARAHAERVRDLRSGLQPRRQSPGCRLASARSGPCRPPTR